MIKNALRLWIEAADTVELNKLATLAGTTVGNIQQIAGSYRTGGVPSVRSGLASKIERAINTINRTNPRLPSVVRTDLSPECRDCEFAQRCLKGAAIASDFHMVGDA